VSMSAMTWVWTHSRSKNGARLVLLAIADVANDNGRNAWPSVKTLRTKANLSERAVQKAIKDLIELGELKVEFNQGPYGSNWYTILMDKTPAVSAPPQYLRGADTAGVETGVKSDSLPQDPPQILHPADSAPPQKTTATPADSAPKPKNPTTKKTSSSSTGTRGTRIPDDFKITPEMAAWGRKEVPAITGQMADRITAEFIDYWRGAAGAKGVKLDWEATWRNWLRREADKLGGRSSPPRGGYQPYDNPTDPNAYSGGIQ
jgi:hypothetical protein